jgi:antitoxin (DNA-binding transcriptional repressor) of toxin-antitoxin stability system
MMLRLNIRKTKTHLTKYLRRMEKEGEPIIVFRCDIPIAEIHPLKPPLRGKRPLGLAKGKAKILPSFWDPLPDWMLDAFEGKETD